MIGSRLTQSILFDKVRIYFNEHYNFSRIMLHIESMYRNSDLVVSVGFTWAHVENSTAMNASVCHDLRKFYVHLSGGLWSVVGMGSTGTGNRTHGTNWDQPGLLLFALSVLRLF